MSIMTRNYGWRYKIFIHICTHCSILNNSTHIFSSFATSYNDDDNNNEGEQLQMCFTCSWRPECHLVSNIAYTRRFN